MYSIKVQADGKTYPLFLSGIKALPIINPVLTLEMGMQGSLAFQIPVTHPYRNKIRILSSEFFVYQDDEELFRGRYIGRERDFYLTGRVTCEGDLAYLMDSPQRPYEHQGTIVKFLDDRLEAHNNAVEKRKQFARGIVNVVDNNNYINRSSQEYSNTLESLRGKLVATHGGYLRTRKGGDARYLDYVTDYGGINSQVIRLGENLLDMTEYLDSATLITALIPLGAEVEYQGDTGETLTKIVDITSVNNGIDYIYDQNAVNRYGWIFGFRQWEDVTLPENLLKKARAYLEETVNLPETMELKAVDLSVIDVNIEKLKLGFWTKVISGPHEVTGQYLLTKKVIYLDDPANNTITLGGQVASYAASSARSQLDMSRKVQQTAQSTSREINRKVENATELITGGLGGYIVIGRAEDGHPEELLIMDAPSKETAKNVIRLNKNGLGFSTTGYNGVYRNAWTIDGNLVADFITTGTMLADRIRGGTLEVGGSGLGKDGVITIRDASGGLLCQIDRNGMQFYDGQNNVTAVFSTSGVDVRKGSIKGANITLGGAGNADGWMKLYDASGNEVAILDLNGLDLQKGSIHGADITLGGAGNANGWMKLLDASGNVIFNADNTGLYIYRGIIINYSADGNSRATMTDGNFKTWRGDNVTSFLGEGVNGVVGDDGYPILFLGRTGYGTWITLNTRDGCIAGGYVNASDRDSTFAGAEFNGGVSVHSTLTAERVEAPDVFGGGTSLETLNNRCGSLGERCDSIEERVAALEQKAGG